MAKWVLALAVLVGCSGSSSEGPRPLVSEMSAAVDAVEAQFGGAELEYFEVSADLEGVTVVLAEREVDSTGTTSGMFATPYRWEGGTLTRTSETMQAEGATFLGSALNLDPSTIFTGIESELDDPSFIDLAVQGSESGIIIDVTVENSKGGRLLVLVNPEGRVLGVQAS
ncbi:MAG: hypothetical protein ACO3VI_08820 [Ilumatobacteraceae bacterium]